MKQLIGTHFLFVVINLTFETALRSSGVIMPKGPYISLYWPQGLRNVKTTEDIIISVSFC